MAVALEERDELVRRDAGEDGGVRDLVAVQLEDRQDGAVGRGVQELVRVPARRERPRLGLAVADHAADDQVRVVERGAIRVDQRVAQLAALVDRARGLGRDVAGDAARERELPEQPPEAGLVARDRRVGLGVRPLEVGVRDEARAAVAGAGDVDRLEVVAPDHPVHVGVDEVQAGCRAPVAEEARLDVLRAERLPQQRVVEEVDLADREVVRGPPVGVDPADLVVREWAGRSRCAGHCGHGRIMPPPRFRGINGARLRPVSAPPRRRPPRPRPGGRRRRRVASGRRGPRPGPRRGRRGAS